MLVKAPNTGLPIQSPYLPVLNRQTEIARKLAAELALPPAQRNRMGPHGPETAARRPGTRWRTEMSRKPPAPSLTPGVAIAVAYCRDVLAGRIAACRLVHLTCERFLRDLAAAEAGQGPWAFRPELAERAMIFAGLMPNISGPEAGRPLRLMPWQRLVFANLFGFVEREHRRPAVPPGDRLCPPRQRQDLHRRAAGALPQLHGWRGRRRRLCRGGDPRPGADPVRHRPADGAPLPGDPPPLRRRGAGERDLAGAHQLELPPDQLGRQGAGRAERADRRLRRDRLAPHQRGLRRAAHRDGQAAQSAAARHLDRHRQQRRDRQAALGLRRPGAGGHAGGRAAVRADLHDRSGGRSLGGGVLDQGQPGLGPDRPAGCHPRHHAPDAQQPGAGSRGQDPAPEHLGQRRRGAVLAAELA